MTSTSTRIICAGTTVFSTQETASPCWTLANRLREVEQRLAVMADLAKKEGKRGVDIAVFPEEALNNPVGNLHERALALDETLTKMLGGLASAYGTWLVVGATLMELERKRIFNAALLFNRRGELAGIYRKAYCVPDADGTLEGGKTPGTEFPVFETEWGKIAIMICYDMGFDEVIATYAEKGAEIILWPSASPQTLVPRLYARRFGVHIVSSTPRKPAVVIDPLGEIIARKDSEGVVIADIALDYRIVHWQPSLCEGRILSERYGEGIGYRYSLDEDYGMFWSNDPHRSINEMLSETGIKTDTDMRLQARVAREKIIATL